MPFVNVKASNFGPHENVGPFLRDPHLLWVNSLPKMNRIDFANRKFVYNFYSIDFSVGRVLIPPITYYWTGLLILDNSYLVGNLTNSKISETKALEPLKS